MTIKERIIKILEIWNIKHFSREGEIEVFPPLSTELLKFLELINVNEEFVILGGYSHLDMRTPEELKDDDNAMHLYIRFLTKTK